MGRGHCGGSSGVAQVDGTGRKRGNVGWIRFIHIALIDTAMQLNQTGIQAGSVAHPKPLAIKYTYGTAGFRTT